MSSLPLSKAMKSLFIALAMVGAALVPSLTEIRAQDKPEGEAPKAEGEKKDGELGSEENDLERVKGKDKAVDDFESKKKATGVTPDEAEQIKKAIEKGATQLAQLQNGEGSFGYFEKEVYRVGGQALVLLTLIKCGMPRESQVIQKGMKWLRKAYEDEKTGSGGMQRGGLDGKAISGTMTYSAGVILMLLETYYTEQPKPRKNEKKDGKTKAPKAEDDDPKHLGRTPADDAWIRELVKHLEKTQNSNTGIWGYPENAPYGPPSAPQGVSQSFGEQIWADFSNTQYAVLGLKAAARMGYRVSDPDIYRKVADYCLKTQDTDGPKKERMDVEIKETQDGRRTGYFKKTKEFDRARGWTYTGLHRHKNPAIDSARTGSMTTAALATLIVAKSELIAAYPKGKTAFEGSEMDNKINEAVWDGIAWIDEMFSVQINPAAEAACNQKRPYPMWHYYYLYGLERAGIFAGRDFFGENEWYPLGARYLVAAQAADGSWAGSDANHKPGQPGGNPHGSPIGDTCFALLFLKRASFPVGKPVPKPIITGTKK